MLQRLKVHLGFEHFKVFKVIPSSVFAQFVVVSDYLLVCLF